MDETTRNAMRRPVRVVLIICALLLIGYFGYSWIAGYVTTPWSTFQGQVVPNTQTTHFAPPQALQHFGTYFPKYFAKTAALLGQLLFLSLFLIIQFAALFWFMSRGRTYAIFPGEYDVTFDDVRGQPAIVDATKQVVKLFQGFKDFRKRGGYPPQGILFDGPPGTGKTLLVNNIFIIGATNQASTLDPALLRPGRFDRKVHVGLPAGAGRKDILAYYLAKVPHEDMDLDKLSRATLGHSPAQIKNVINEA